MLRHKVKPGITEGQSTAGAETDTVDNDEAAAFRERENQ